jgi:hypothetical protein
MSALSPLPDYKREICKGNNDNFQLWYKQLVDFISQPFYYESSQLNPPNQKTWSASAMAFMSFIDTIPYCNENDWNTWDMQDLIDDTNANTPGRITPAMEAQLIKVELDLVNIVNTGLQFNELCVLYFLKQFQTHLFLITLIRRLTHLPFP